MSAKEETNGRYKKKKTKTKARIYSKPSNRDAVLVIIVVSQLFHKSELLKYDFVPTTELVGRCAPNNEAIKLTVLPSELKLTLYYLEKAVFWYVTVCIANVFLDR